MIKLRVISKKIAVLVMGTVLLLQMPVKEFSVKAESMPEANWTLLPEVSDEFNGNELDTEKWTNGIWYDVSTDLAFKNENVSVRDGKLILTAKKENYNGKSYTAGAVESKFDVPGTDSYVEVRAKALNKKANVLSAIWMQSSPLTKALNPNPEIDIMETFDYSKMTSTIHTWRQNPSIHLQMGTNAWKTGLDDISADYHTYGLERRNGKLRFYFDGKLAWEKKPLEDSFVQLSRHMVLSLEGHLGNPVDAYLPGEFLIDYVRTYYNSDFAGVPTEGSYQLVNRRSEKILNVPGASTEDSKQLVQSTDNGSSSASWRLIKNEDGTYCIQNIGTEKYMDLTADTGVTSNGNSIIQYKYHGGTNQRWYIVPTDNGYFRIVSALSGKAMCVKNASKEENAPIIQWTFEGADTNDEWKFVQP